MVSSVRSDDRRGLVRDSSSLIQRVWSRVLCWLRVFWVCRIPLVSVLAGMALFIGVEPARDLFLEPPNQPLHWTQFLILVPLWAIVTHFTSRKLLEQQAWAASGARLPLAGERLIDLRQRYAWPATWVPRLLGLACFVAVGLGIVLADADVRPIAAAFGLNSPLPLLWGLLGGLVFFVIYVLFRRRITDPAARQQPLGAYLSEAFEADDSRLIIEPSAFWFVDLMRGRHGPTRLWDWSALLLFLVQVGALGIAMTAPLGLAAFVSRAPFVVLMLALPIATLSYLSALSHQWRFPVVAIALVGLSVATGLRGGFNDLRTADPTPAGLRQLAFEDAVKDWRTANGCPGGPGIAACPARPVIIASAGGASRAAFFTASVVGALLDEPDLHLNQRLFALSGVSGGAVGAAMIRAALADGGTAVKPPCGRLDSLWFGPADAFGEGAGKQPIHWRECLQVLAAGDFLSPAFIGLAFRDLFGFVPGLDDRAALLEEAFESRYMSLTGHDSLERFIGDPRPSTWTPLLLLNATTVRDGRRAILSDLAPVQCTEGQPPRLFPMAYDLFELIAERVRRCGDTADLGTAVRLSTAATASARFPVVSPQAVVRTDRAAVAAELVDGGYFENDGLTTARELATALVAHGLKPIILHVTNNPTAEIVRNADREPLLPEARNPGWDAALTAPIDALLGTRDGHAAEAAFRAAHTPDVEVLSFEVYTHLPVLAKGQACTFRSPGSLDGAPTMQDLSMSWWLSGAVQEYLDRQLCHPDNVKSFNALLAAEQH